MRRSLSALVLALSLAALASCSHSRRYQVIADPHLNGLFCRAPGNAADTPYCGITILDTETGVILTREMNGWREENPHTGQIVVRSLIGGNSYGAVPEPNR